MKRCATDPYDFDISHGAGGGGGDENPEPAAQPTCWGGLQGRDTGGHAMSRQSAAEASAGRRAGVAAAASPAASGTLATAAGLPGASVGWASGGGGGGTQNGTKAETTKMERSLRAARMEPTHAVPPIAAVRR